MCGDFHDYGGRRADESKDRTPMSEEEDAPASCCCLGVAYSLVILLSVTLLPLAIDILGNVFDILI